MAVELAFLAAALLAHPHVGSVAASLWSHQPLGDRRSLPLVAANIGAVVMPWMIFYQQGAVVEKGLRERQIRIARLDTALGAVLTQAVMAATLVATAATRSGPGARSPVSIGGISIALSPYLGAFASRLTLALGLAGAACWRASWSRSLPPERWRRRSAAAQPEYTRRSDRSSRRRRDQAARA